MPDVGNGTNRPLLNFSRFVRQRCGNVSAIMALLLIPLIGSLALASQASNLWLAQRMAQNAADSAVVAAATNGCGDADACHTISLLPTYAAEARSVSAQHGFTDGVGDVVVTPSDSAACPGGGTCYSVQIDRKVPVGLLQIVGFNGDTTSSSGGAAQYVRAVAMAKRAPGTGFCITTYGPDPDSFRIAGGPNFNLAGCDVYAQNGGVSCNNDSGDSIRYSVTAIPMTSNKPCGTAQATAQPGTDYAALASNIPNPTTACGGVWPQYGKKTSGTALPGGNYTFSSASPKCGDLKLTGNVTVTADSVLVIENGSLDLNGFKLATAAGAHLTIVFGGTSDTSYDHIITSSVNGAVLDYSAPKTGTWSGVAFYQDPALPAGTGVNMTYSGNNPDFNITGLFYAPKSKVSISGAIDHATNGDACLAFMVYTLSVVGTGSIFAAPTRECDRAGLTGLGKIYDKVVMVL